MQGNPQEAILAYAAGIIDGEGSIMITRTFSTKLKEKYRRKNNWYYPRVRVGMTDEAPLELLERISKDLGIKGSRQLECARPNRQPLWRWQLTDRHSIVKFLTAIRPYLLNKARNADLLIKFCEEWKRPKNMKLGVDKEELLRREEAYLKMRKFNAVGAFATTEC